MDELLAEKAKRAGLKPAEARELAEITDWPTPGSLIKGNGKVRKQAAYPPLLSGSRLKVFEEAYRYWYAELSSYAHQRALAAERAVFAHYPDYHDEPGAIESSVVSEALLFFAAIMAEIQVSIGAPPSMGLRRLWVDLLELDQLAHVLADLRYRRLLLLPDAPQRT